MITFFGVKQALIEITGGLGGEHPGGGKNAALARL
jgi:hypothetical protein